MNNYMPHLLCHFRFLVNVDNQEKDTIFFKPKYTIDKLNKFEANLFKLFKRFDANLTLAGRGLCVTWYTKVQITKIFL